MMGQIVQFKRELAVVAFGDESQANMIRIKSLEEGSVVVKGSVEAENEN